MLTNKIRQTEAMEHTASSIDRARLLAVSEIESEYWLHALPSSKISTLLDNTTFQTAIALRLGLNSCEPHRCPCGFDVDRLGHHGQSCVKSAGRFFRHGSINDLLRRSLAAIAVPAVLEPSGVSRDDGRRPDGMTLVPWRLGRALVWMPLALTRWRRHTYKALVEEPGRRQTRHSPSNVAICERITSDYEFVAFAVETMGPWGADAKQMFRELSHRLVDVSGDQRVGFFLAQRISLAIQRGNVASVLGTMPHGSVLDEIFELSYLGLQMNMRFNKQELFDLASQPSQKFDKEGLLLVKEKQDGFFRRTENPKAEQVVKTTKDGKRDSLRNLSCVGAAAKVSLERWCRLRGNLLFYLRGPEQWSEPVGVIVLEQCTVTPMPQGEYWPFQIIFEGGASYKMSALTESDRTSWLQAISLATYEYMKSQILALQRQLNAKCGINTETDIQSWRIDQCLELDLNEVPICELSLSCDNLLCDSQGRPPSVFLVMHVRYQTGPWIRYASTEVIKGSSNPSYLCTVSFRASDGINGETLLRIMAHDMKECVSNTYVPMGSANIHLNTIQESQRIRIGLTNNENRTVGFLTLNGWSLEPSISPQSPASPKHGKTSISLLPLPKILAHRRSQSLPPRLGVKILLPAHGPIIKNLFANIHQVPYRFHSGLGGDITVHEVMMESKICFTFPQQLLSIFIQREKELLQEVICMGELGNQWKSRQMELLDTHLSLLKHYSHARQSLEQYETTYQGRYFKQSCLKSDVNLEFAPVNLHIQRMWVHNDTLNKSGFYDFVTVGAFTAHAHRAGKSKGLISLVQDLKASSTQGSIQCASASRVQMACDAVQAMKILRQDLVNIMRTLLALSKTQETNGMMPLAEAMVTKTRALLSLWDPGLVEEALLFIDTHKVSNIVKERPTNIERQHRPQMLSPFKRLSERLSMLDLRSPELEDFATPSEPKRDVVWSTTDNSQTTSSDVQNSNDPMPKSMPNSNHDKNIVANELNIDIDASETDKIKLICDERVTVDFNEKPLIFINDHFKDDEKALDTLDEFHTMKFHTMSSSYNPLRTPITQYFVRTEEVVPSPSRVPRTQPIDMKGHSSKSPSTDTSLEVEFVYNDDSDMRLKVDKDESVELFAMSFEEMNMPKTEFKNNIHAESTFNDPILKNYLDIRTMTTSPSANYYKPTDEPEPWDLTQLNIEASVMCLVSKVKFLCGRTGSPAVRLRGQKTIVGGKVMKKANANIVGQTFPDGAATEGSLTAPAKNSNVPLNNSEKPSLIATDDSKHNLLSSHVLNSKTIEKNLEDPHTTRNEVDVQKVNDEKKQTGSDKRDTSVVGGISKGNIDEVAENKEISKYQKEGAMTRKGINKFTDGLNLADVTDWPAEMRPPMRKLRQAMDGFLKTGRLAHAALRLRCETLQRRRSNAALQIRRDTCFCQALTTVTTGLLTWLWSTDPTIVRTLLNACLGPLVCFEGLLSLYATEVAMWGDMVIAIEDLHTVVFTLTIWDPSGPLTPQIFGTRNCLNVTLPVLESLYLLISCKQYLSFTITAVYFNVGINEKANLAETLGNNVPQEHSNWDNFDKFNKYYNKYKKVFTQKTGNAARASSRTKPLEDIIETLSVSIQKKIPKNIEILELAANATRQMNGIRVISCKSAKDRTGMSCTLEQCRILSTDYHLAEHEFDKALDCMRSEGCRRENTLKNTGVRKYAFNKLQVMALPKSYRPPQGSYGSAQT